MVRSRKYALITAALALILIAAVVLAVVLTGNGTYYDRSPEGSVSESEEVGISPTTGTVDNREEYLVTTLLKNSSIGDIANLTAENMQDLRNSNGDVYDAGAAKDGINDTYVIKLNPGVRLLTNDGWTTVERGDLNTDTTYGGAGVFDVKYNGIWYRFENGTTGKPNENGVDYNALYQTFNNFLTKKDFYQQSYNYGLIVEPTGDVYYDPNDTSMLSWFDATLDGAGATIMPTAVLNFTWGNKYGTSWAHEVVDYEDGKNNNSAYEIDRGVQYIRNDYMGGNLTRNTEGGIGFVGLLFGAMRYGSFRNFIWSDEGLSGDHYFHYGSKKSGTAFGGLVGLAGPSDNMESGARSSIYNVQMDFNNDLDHRMGFGNHGYNNLADTRCDIYSGGLLGINLNADVELVDINYNGIRFSQYALRGQNHSYSSSEKGEWGQSSFGGVIGAQSNVYRKDMTVSKITVTGLKSATMFASATVEKEWGNSWSGPSRYNNIYTMIGGIIGGLYGDIDIKGVIFDMNYDKIFNMWDGGPGGARDNTGWQRGILVGHIFSSVFNTSDIYVTNKIFGADSYTSEAPTISAIGNNKEYSMKVDPFGNYTTKYSYIGGVDENNSYTDTYKRFVYLEDTVVSSVSFTDDTYTEYVDGVATTKEYMLQISAPAAAHGVMWDITYNVDKGSASKNHEYLYMQNLQDNVNLKGVSNISLTDQTAYMTMSIQYASSYNFELVNGHNDTGESTKVYNGERVNYATLDLTAQSSDTVITTNYQPIYVQIGLDGKVTFHNNSGGTLTNMTNFRTSGNEQNSNFANLVSSIFQLEFATNVDEGMFSIAQNWDAQVDVNTYRWSSLGLFAVETSNGRFVFAPNTGTQAEVQITQRPISLNLLNPNAPYIGEAYSLAYNPEGGDYASVIDGKVHYNFTSSVNDGYGGLIKGDVVSFIPSGNSFTARDAGNYVLNGTLSGADSGNYQYSVGDSFFTIEPAQAVITINGGSMVYGTRPTQAELAGLVNYSVSLTNTGTYLSSGFAAADGITPSFNMQTSLDTATSAGWMFARAGASVFNNNFPADDYDVVVDALTGTGVKNYVVSEVVVGTQFSVTPRPLTSTLPAVNGFIYGDAVAPTVGTPVFAGWASGDSRGDFEIKYYLSETSAEYTYDVRFGAGTYYVRAVPTVVNAPGSVNGVNNYEVNYNDPLFEVEKRDTYVDFPYDPALTYTYKAEPYDFEARALSNGASGDTVDDVLFAAYSDPERKNKVDALNAGTYYPGATSETLSANYNILGVRDNEGNEWATFVIGRATVSLSLAKLTLVYNGAERDFDLKNVTISSDVESLQEELEGLKEKLVFLYNNSSVKPQDAATYNVTVNLPQQLNYNAATASLTGGLVIEQLGIVINASDKTVTYNGAVIPEIDFTVAAVDGADVSSLPEGWADKLAISVAYEKDGSPVTSLRNVGTYSVTYTYDGSAGNFKSASKTITYKVDPKPLDFVLNNANVTYNKQAYVPDYDLTGAVIGDTVNAVLSASENGVPVETIVDAGTYDIIVSLVDGTGAPTGNYTVAADGLQVVVAPYEIFAREINTTLFFNSAELGAAYYEGQMKYTVIDADGTDITGSVTVTRDLIGLDNDEAVETVADRGGEYRASLTLELPAGYDPDNYSVQTNVYNVYIYRIALRAVLSQESVTFGDEYNVKGQLYAMAGDAEQPFTVGADGVVAGFNEDILSDVTGLTVTSASMTISGSDLGGNAVDGTLSEVIDAIFNSGIYDAEKMANAGTYSVTVTVNVNAVYTESTSDREVTISAPFTWTVDPYEIKVDPAQLDTYYTEAITADDVMGAVVFEGGDEQYKSFVTAVSAAIGDGTSYVNAGEYDYDLVLNTNEDGYFNYTLSAVETGKINVQQLTVQVSAADATVEYGNAVTLSSAEVRIFKGDPESGEDVTESVAGLNLSAQYPYSLTTDYKIGDPVADYVIKAQPGSVTENFAFLSEDGTLKVTQRSIGIKLDNIEMVYGTASLPEITFTLESGSLYGSEVVTLETSSLKITAGSSAEEVVAESDYDRIDANTYSYTFESITLSNDNYVLTAKTSGVLTVTPYQIASVEWSDPAAALTYRGKAFLPEEMHTIAAQTMPNGDVVTFGVNYGGEVRSAGIYTAIATVASVKNGEEEVEKGNYDVSRVATRSLTVGRASLTLAGVDNAGTMSVENVYNASAQALEPSRLVFTFGDATYDADRDGALGLTLSYAQGGVSATPEHAGSYDVTVVLSSSNANFTPASFSGVSFVITRWELSAEEFKENVSVNIPENLKYTSSAQGATLSFTNILADENIAYTLNYYVLGEEGAMATDPSEPVNAASYAVKVTIDTADVYYVSAESEGTLVIAPNDSIDLNGFVTADAGAGENAKYYTGGPLYPNVEATISGLRGAAAEIIVTDNSAFEFTFFVRDENGTEITFAENTVKVADPAGQKTAVTPDYYYVRVTFNPGGQFDSNYAADITLDLVLEDDSPLVFQITTGSMLIRVNSGSTAEYNGLSGFNGRDVIYKDEDGLWRINTEIITFVGVDLASMTNLISELKVGDITIDVAVYFGNHEETGVPLYSTLYTWEWLRSGGEGDDRSEPTKTVYTKPIMEDVQLTTEVAANVQTKGPVNGIFDFGYSDGLSTATYLISVSVDNTVNGSYYSPAQTVKYDENGQIVTDDNDDPVYIDGPHTASGGVNIAPAETQFELFYTSDFYQSGADMLEGGYKELNELMEKAEGVPVELLDEWLSGAHFYIRGARIAPEAFANAPELGTAVGTDGAYMVSNAGVSGIIGGNGYGGNVESANYSVGGYYYERISTGNLHITITDSEGNVVYTKNVSGQTDGSKNGGITDAGTYRISITFDGMPGKYSAYSYSCDFVQQKAEYHIVVSETAGANLTVKFGTQFDVSGLQDQLEIELETGENAVVTGSYDDFVTAFENFKDGDQSALNGFIELVGTSGGGATEYNGYTTPVGDYYIYYVYESVNDNLEVIMETSDSRIVVTPAAPELLLKTDGSSEYVADEKIIADSAYRAGYDWTDDLLSQVMLGLKYKDTEGVPVGEYYASNALAVSEVQYRVSGDSDWGMLTGSSIGAVGQYRISFVSTDDNLEGEAPYSLTFTVTKISATAYIINIDELNGQQYTGAQFALDSFFEVRDDATGEVVPAAALAGTPEFNIYTQFDEDANDGAGAPVEESKVEFVRDAGTYYIAVSVTGSANYNVTASEFVTITIEKADLRVRFAGESYSAVYNRASGNTVGSIYTYELNGRSITPSGVTEIYYLRGAADQTAVQEFVAAYLAALEGNEALTITQWLEENAETYAGYEFTSVNGTNAATDVGTYYPIVVYGGDTNFNKSARLIDNGVYPEFVITPAALRVEMVYNVNYEITYGDLIDDITGNDVVSQYAILRWNEQVGVGSDGQPIYSTIGDIDEFSAATGANIALSLINRNVYAVGNAAGTYSSAFQLNVELTYDEGEYNNFELIYTPDFLDLTVAKKSVNVDIRRVAVKLGESGPQTLAEGGVKFNGVYNGSSFGTLALVVGNDFVFGIKGEGYDDTVVDADSGKYGVLTVTMSGTLAEGGAMIAGSYSSSVDFALNNANYTIDLYDGESKLTTLGSIDGTPYSVPVSLDVAKAVLRVEFDELTYKWLNETYREDVNAGSGEHQGWWEYVTMYTGRNFRRNERLLIQSGYYNGSEWVPYGVYDQQVKLGDIINATELGIVVTDGESGMLAAAGEYSFHLAISSTNYEFERADKSRSSAIDVNITISPSEALEVNLDLAPLFTENGKVWEREFDGMTINTRTIMGEYLEVYRYEIPQGANALTDEVTLEKTSLGDVTDGVFAQGVNVTLAGDNAVGGSIIYAGDYDLIVNVNMDNMAERTEVAKLKITPAKQGSVTTEITNRSKSGMTYNGSSIVPSFDFKITVKEALSDVTHTQKVNSYSVRVSRDGEELFTYAVEGGVVNMTDEQRAMLANAGVYTFELIVDSATMPNLEDGATFASDDAITIEARKITDRSIRSSYRESFDFKSANGEAVAVTKEGINFIAYYNRDTLLEYGTDYELTFNGEAGKYTGEYHFKVTGKGNFTDTITGTYYIGASVGPTEAPAALTYGADDKITVKLAVNSLAPGSADIINDIHLAFDDSARLVTEGGTTVSQLRLESISPEGGNFIAVFGGAGAVNAGTYYLSLSFSCEYEYVEGKVIGSGGEINIDVSGRDVCEVVVQPASAKAVADSVNAVLTEVNSNNVTFVIDGKANVYEYSIDGTTWVKAYKGENTVTGLTPSEHYTIKFRMNDSNYAEGGVTVYPLPESVNLSVDTTTNVDEILAQAQELAGNFSSTGFGRYVQLMDDLNSVSVADREARAEEIEEALAAIEEARSEYMADLQAAIDSAVDTAEKATGKGIGVSAVGTAAVVGGAAMPAALGIGFIFAAARKRKSKEEDLND